MKTTLVCVALVLAFASSSQIPNYVPLNGLQGYWPFTGNANDISGNGYNGSVNGAALTTDRFNLQNNAYNFNGSSDYISTSFVGILGANPRAVAFWAKTLNTTTPMYTINWGNNTAGNRFNTSFNASGNGASYSAAYNSFEYATPVPISNNVWHHYVYQFSNPAFNQLQVYQDGVLLTSISNTAGNITAPFNTTAGFNVLFGGHGNLTPIPPPAYFQGQLDDIGIWNRVLSQCEIQQLYNSSLSTVILSSANATICAGNATTLNASGASSYTWITLSNIVSNSVVVSPNITTVYSVISDCGATNTISVFINSNPFISVTTNAELLCFGLVATLTANGGVSYLWNVGSIGANIYVSPPGNTTYTVTGTGSNGCSAAAVFTQSVTLCTGIGEETNTTPNIFIYPAPTNGFFSIGGIDHYSTIEVYDAFGKVIYRNFSNISVDIDLSEQLKGIYIVKISFGNNSIIKKIIRE